MKKFISVVMLVVVLMAGFSGERFDKSEVSKRLDSLNKSTESYLTGALSKKEYTQEIESFSDYLADIKTDDNNVRQFIELQSKANTLRIAGLNEGNSDKITESSRMQDEANVQLSEK